MRNRLIYLLIEGNTFATAFAAPVVVGMIDIAAARGTTRVFMTCIKNFGHLYRNEL